MAIKDMTAGTVEHFTDRIRAITADSPRKWGTMTPAQMCRHMTLSIAGGLGEVEFQNRSNVVIRALLPVLFSGYIPFPKGRAKTAPEYVAKDVDEFDAERDALLAAIDRFMAWCKVDPNARAQHPFFGNMTVAQWQRGHALHLEHHLRQFGV